MAQLKLQRKWYVTGQQRTDSGTKLMVLAVQKMNGFETVEQ